MSEIISMLKNKHTRSLMTYFSDHGEDVYDTPPHNMLGRNEGKPTAAMYTVPFIIWQSPEWQASQQVNLNEFVNRPYSTSHFIHTWADLTGITFKDFDPSKSIINKAFEKRPLLIGNPKAKSQLQELIQ
jgi:heptose-I-phosphate ethanolaminephosphotransferase